MTSYDIYVFILCLIVFTLLTAVFACTLAIMAKQSLRLIETGTEDERIYEEHIKMQQRKKKKSGWFSTAFTVLFVCIVTVIFGFTLIVQLSENKQTKNMPTLRVVYSESMSAKYEKNDYLFENNLNDQFSRFDIVVTYKLPKEEELKLYDIVVYEVDNTLLIHRIVGIEEPNERHPNERYFVLQGDLVERADKFPVRYSQMKAIYRGEHVPFIGSFVMFLQSPAGYICLILVLVEMIATPLVTQKMRKAEQARLAILLQKDEEERKEKEAQKALEESSVIEQLATSEEEHDTQKEALAHTNGKTVRIGYIRMKKKRRVR